MPDDAESRFAVFLFLFFMTFFQVLSKGIGTALLACVRFKFAIAFVTADVIFYCFVKILRDDLRYWLNIDGPLGVMLTALSRVMIKVIVDNTCIVHFRKC